MPVGSTRASALLTAIALSVTACGGGAAAGDPTAGAVAPAGSADAGPAPAELREPNTLDGIYTAAQAERGRQLYEDVCADCHQLEEWQDDLFLARWNGESVYRFWTYIYERMPNGAPPYSLPRASVSDAVSFILSLNGVPAGTQEFGSDEDAVAEHWLYWGPSAGG